MSRRSTHARGQKRYGGESVTVDASKKKYRSYSNFGNLETQNAMLGIDFNKKGDRFGPEWQEEAASSPTFTSFYGSSSTSRGVSCDYLSVPSEMSEKKSESMDIISTISSSVPSASMTTLLPPQHFPSDFSQLTAHCIRTGTIQTFTLAYTTPDLGTGTFSGVFSASCSSNFDMPVCVVKRFNQTNTTGGANKHYTDEIKALRYLIRPDIDLLETHIINPLAMSDTEMCIVFEPLCECNLFQRIVAASGETMAFRGHQNHLAFAEQVLQQLFVAVSYLHASGVGHMDIKCENVLILRSQPLHILLADFGCAKPLGHKVKGIQGSIQYRAPEVSREHSYDVAPCDVYSCAVVYFHCLALHPPFDQPTVACPFFASACYSEWANFWHAHGFPSGIENGLPDPYKALFERVCGPNPNDRPTAAWCAQEANPKAGWILERLMHEAKAAEGKIHIYLNTHNGLSQCFILSANATVSELKGEIRESGICHPNHITLSSKGQFLADHQKLSWYGIKDWDIISTIPFSFMTDTW